MSFGYSDRDYDFDGERNLSVLVGKTLLKVERDGDDEIRLFASDDTKYRMRYYEDCCASCSIEEVHGDLDDLVGSPILLAEEVSSGEPNEALVAERKARYEKELAEFKPKYDGDEFYYYGAQPDNGWEEESETWTFYKLATNKGSVTIRWYGSSNGYYSERATFEEFR